jgi:hypothetical protein
MNSYLWSSALLLAALSAPTHAMAQGCTLSLGPTDIDFGRFNRTTLQPAAEGLALPTRRLNLTLACETEQDLTLGYRTAETSPRGFALGRQGVYQLSLLQASVDGQAVQWTQSQTTDSRSANAWAGVLKDDRTLQPVRAGSVVRGKHLTAQVQIDATLDLSVRDASDAHLWQTRGTFEIAGQQRDLHLQVGFAPAACRPTLGAGGEVDFGRIGLSELNRETFTSFSRQTTLQVDCDAATRFALRAVDNRAGTVAAQLPAPPSVLFGIGRSRAGLPLGGFTARLGTGTGQDGTAAAALLGDSVAQVWRQAPDAFLHHDGQASAFKGAQSPGALPEAWQSLSIPLIIDLHLAPARQLDLREETAIDGSATLEIIYL